MAVPERGIEKLAFASAMMRGTDLPSVTFLMLDEPSSDTRSVAAHPVEPPLLQSDPVKPLVQMQEHVPAETILAPPLRHVKDLRQFSTLSSLLSLFPKFLNTKNSRGT